MLQTNVWGDNPKQLSPLVLAYIGDAVFELMVRHQLVNQNRLPVHRLHQMSVARVCASAQSAAVERLLEILTQEESDIYKRGRNTNGHIPKNADVIEYRRATGLEALFGYLYLKQCHQRIAELFSIIWD